MALSPFGNQSANWEEDGPSRRGPSRPGASSGGTGKKDGKGSGIPPWSIAVFALIAVSLIGFLLLQGSPAEDAGNGANANPSSTSSSTVSTIVVPSVLGSTESEAVSKLQASGLTVGEVTTEINYEVEPGTVLRQSPAPGTQSSSAEPVKLVIAITDKTRVPDVVSLKREEAVQALLNAKLTAGDIVEVNSESPLGEVLEQSVKVGALVPEGSPVSLKVSNGKSAVPDVSGRSAQDAETLLINAGFEVKIVKRGTSASNTVLGTDPTSGTYLKRGEVVTVVLPKTVIPAPGPSPSPTQTEDPLCNSLYFYLEIEKAAKELGIKFIGITDYKCSGEWGVVDAAFGEEPNVIYETLVIRRSGDTWTRFPREEACASPSPLPADLFPMACEP